MYKIMRGIDKADRKILFAFDGMINDQGIDLGDSPVHPLTWSTVSVGPDVVSCTSVRPSADLVTDSRSICALYAIITNIFPVANHFNSTSHSLGDMSILGLLQCHSDTTQ
eukprot:g48272.t1